MADVNDFQNFGGQLQSELEKVEEGEGLVEVEQKAINEFVRALNANLKESSLTEYVRRVRHTARRTDIPLTKTSKTGIEDHLFELEHNSKYGRGGGGMSENTLRNYRKGLRVFFQFLGREWADELEIGAPPKNEVRKKDMLDQDDIAALVEAATVPRDIAIIEFLSDTGARASVLGTLRVGDVKLDRDKPHYTPNEQAKGLKDAPQKPYPIIDAVAPMRSYLRYSHPQPENDDAAFFHKLVGAGTDVDELETSDTALSSQQLNRRLRQIGEKAGVDKPVNPHNFRHSAITRMYREGFEKQQIQHRVAWNLDTRMWSRYVHIEADELNDQIFADAGLIDREEAGSNTERRPCGNCREVIAPHHQYCPNCGEPVSPETRELKSSAMQSLSTGMVEVEDMSRREFRAYILQRLDADASDLGHQPSPSSSID